VPPAGGHLICESFSIDTTNSRPRTHSDMIDSKRNDALIEPIHSIARKFHLQVSTSTSKSFSNEATNIKHIPSSEIINSK
jgi:hypothetical protein